MDPASQSIRQSAPRTQQQRSAATQRRLLEATLDCIVERGYAATSTPEICRRAGVSRGAQLHHFPNKAKLVAAAIEHLFTRRHEELRAELGGLSGDLDLDAAFDALWEIYSGPTLHAWQDLVIAARTDDELREQLAGVDDRFTAEARLTCRQLLRLGGVSDDLVAAATRAVLALFDGLALHRVVHPDRDEAETRAWFASVIATWAAANAPGDERHV